MTQRLGGDASRCGLSDNLTDVVLQELVFHQSSITQSAISKDATRQRGGLGNDEVSGPVPHIECDGRNADDTTEGQHHSSSAFGRGWPLHVGRSTREVALRADVPLSLGFRATCSRRC